MKKLLLTFLCMIGISFFVNPPVFSGTIPEGYKLKKVLFTGNSIQFYSKDMGDMFENLTITRSDSDSTIYKCAQAAIESSSLEWRLGTFVQDSIENGGFDYVILQEAITVPEDYPDYFYKYALIWDSIVRANGAEPIHWLNYPHNGEFNGIMDAIVSITKKVGDKTGSKVTPVGLAWEQIIKKEKVDKSFLYIDEWHPTYEGSYLNACMVYSTITGKSPVGLADLVDSSTYLQKVAWEIYQDSISNNPPRNSKTLMFSTSKNIPTILIYLGITLLVLGQLYLLYILYKFLSKKKT